MHQNVPQMLTMSLTGRLVDKVTFKTGNTKSVTFSQNNAGFILFHSTRLTIHETFGCFTLLGYKLSCI